MVCTPKTILMKYEQEHKFKCIYDKFQIDAHFETVSICVTMFAYMR